MSTRGLVLVKKNNEIRIAEYNGHDSYPSSLGVFLYEIINDKDELAFIKSVVDKCKFVKSSDNLSEHEDISSDTEFEDFYNTLKSKANDDVILLTNSSFFGEDSLFCEWAYMVDLDEEKLIVFVGFNEDKDLQDQLFKIDDAYEDGYYGCRRLCEIGFNESKSKEEFLEKIKSYCEKGN